MRLRVASGVPFINPCLCQLTSGGYQRALPALFSWLPHSYLVMGLRMMGGHAGMNGNIYIMTTKNGLAQTVTLHCQFIRYT